MTPSAIETTIIVFLTAGAFAFSSVYFIKNILKKNTSKLSKKLIQNDKKIQKDRLKDIETLRLGKIRSKESLKAFEELESKLKSSLKACACKYKKETNKVFEEEFKKHQSNAFAYGFYGIGYLVMLVFLNGSSGDGFLPLYLYALFFLVYMSILVLGRRIIIIIVYFTSLLLYVGGVFVNTASLLVTQALIVTLVYFIFARQGDNDYFKISKKLSKKYLLYKYGNINENSKKLIFKINKYHYASIIKHLFHFASISFIFFVSFFYENIFQVELIKFSKNYCFVPYNKTSFIIFVSTVLYLLITIVFPIYSLNNLSVEETKKYLVKRDAIWNKEKYSKLVETKEQYTKEQKIYNNLKKHVNKMMEAAVKSMSDLAQSVEKN